MAKQDNEMDCEEVRKAVKQERIWLRKNNAVSAVTDGPVEDLEGVPLLANEDEGTPLTQKKSIGSHR